VSPYYFWNEQKSSSNQENNDFHGSLLVTLITPDTSD
jgi:hypothetical protein